MSWARIERQRAYKREWDSRHHDEVVAYQKQYRATHREYFRSYKARWYKANRTRILAELQAGRDLKVEIAKDAVWQMDPQARYLTVSHHGPSDLDGLLCYNVRYLSAVGDACKLKVLLDKETYEVVTTFYSQTAPPGCGVGDVIATKGV